MYLFGYHHSPKSETTIQYMDFLEKDLEQIIWENSDALITSKGLPIYGTRKRQLRIGNYGVSDIATFHRYNDTLHVTIYELKKNEIDANSLMQAFRYCCGIKKYIKDYRCMDMNVIFHVKLVGRTITNGDFGYTHPFLNNVKVYLYSYGLNGLVFNEHYGFFKIESGFTGHDHVAERKLLESLPF